jgi:cytochrome bd ubiquinol oxidase subunit II
MIWLAIIFLATAITFYVLLGGADFGAGILEIFTRREKADVISKAIAPVWEANHVWLIVVIVILFMGFPSVYSTIMLVLHIPLLLLLVGIILRGSSFTFRYYDIKEERYHRIYTNFFKYSSLFTPLFLGVTLGSVILGRITLHMDKGFYAVFLAPWLNVFSFSLGIFIAILFTFLASLYLLGEVKDQADVIHFRKLFKALMAALVVAGLLVFLSGQYDGLSLFTMFINSPFSIAAVVLATALIPLLFRSINRKDVLWIRLTAGAQTVMVLIGWFMIQYPVLVRIADAPDITVQSAAAPDATINQMILALVVGLLIVIPALMFLFKVFKFGKDTYDY